MISCKLFLLVLCSTHPYIHTMKVLPPTTTLVRVKFKTHNIGLVLHYICFFQYFNKYNLETDTTTTAINLLQIVCKLHNLEDRKQYWMKQVNHLERGKGNEVSIVKFQLKFEGQMISLMICVLNYFSQIQYDISI